MAHELWTWDELLKALPFAFADGNPGAAITGFSIDTRTIEPGNVFVALKDQRDGHDFVTTAFKAGAAAAIVNETYERKSGDGALIKCILEPVFSLSEDGQRIAIYLDTQEALETIGKRSRRRLDASARVIAVTGSAGKTGTKEMLRACLSAVAPGKVHASEKSYNNHWGVPLTLARMPRETQYGVFEIGMNHADEIWPLSDMVRPHAAIVTTVEAVHLEHFGSVEAIADAKAEIFEGLVSGGSAIIKRDNPHFERLRAKAQAQSAKVISFGLDDRADVYAEKLNLGENGSDISARIGERRVSYRIAIPGRHIAENSLAVVAALDAVGAPLEQALAALATLPPPPGRGARITLIVPGVPAGEILLIDESYNANPASMRAALATLDAVSRAKFGRRIAVLGDMLELGPDAPNLHRDLFEAVDGAGIDQLFACGPHMKGLYDAAPAAMKGGYAETASAIAPLVMAQLRAGDAVIVKGSNGTRLGPLVDAIKARFGSDTPVR
jgi:UDP-N-acetylmuramoyl-tripeptide--D-alanyl-D-alanine ligase